MATLKASIQSCALKLDRVLALESNPCESSTKLSPVCSYSLLGLQPLRCLLLLALSSEPATDSADGGLCGEVLGDLLPTTTSQTNIQVDRGLQRRRLASAWHGLAESCCSPRCPDDSGAGNPSAQTEHKVSAEPTLLNMETPRTPHTWGLCTLSTRTMLAKEAASQIYITCQRPDFAVKQRTTSSTELGAPILSPDWDSIGSPEQKGLQQPYETTERPPSRHLQQWSHGSRRGPKLFSVSTVQNHGRLWTCPQSKRL